jgi:hypothetical protein
MYENQVREMVAVTHARTYHLRPHPEGSFLDSGQIRREYAELAREEEESLRQQAERGIISPEEALSYGRLADNVMTRLRLFFDYWWEEEPSDAARPR